MKENLVSIITPIKNGSVLFKSTYESVVNQSHKNFEWIIIDDYSCNKELDEIKKICTDSRIRLIESNKSNGPGKARNIGLKKIKGGFVAFIDADDLWNIDFLEKLLMFSVKNNFDFVFSGYRPYITEKQTFLVDFIPKEIVTADTILKGSDISCLTALIKSNLIDKENRFGYIPCRNDLVLFYRLVTKCPAVPIPKSYATYRVGNNTISSNNFENIVSILC